MRRLLTGVFLKVYLLTTFNFKRPISITAHLKNFMHKSNIQMPLLAPNEETTKKLSDSDFRGDIAAIQLSFS